jgi:hypothetical protein
MSNVDLLDRGHPYPQVTVMEPSHHQFAVKEGTQIRALIPAGQRAQVLSPPELGRHAQGAGELALVPT